MQKEIQLKTKRIVNILVISSIILLFITYFFNYECIFLKVFKIPCISCGLSRAFRYIIKFDLYNAVKHNVLSIPIFIILFCFYIIYIISIVLKKEYIYNLYNIISKKYIFIILILLIGWIMNILIFKDVIIM